MQPSIARDIPSTPSKIYNLQFWLLCLSALLFSASFNMIIPELPGYLSSLGGGDYKGLIISLFTLTAMISRPFSGKLADKIGRIPVMIFGASVCFFCGFLYPVLSSISAFFFLRLIHGFSTGFTPTGQTAFLADVVPAGRRGEALGILGTAGSLGMGFGPPIGSVISSLFSTTILFYTSSLFAIASIMILLGIRETVVSKSRFTVSLLRIRKADLLEPRVIAACIVMGLTAYTYGTIYTVIPDFGQWMGIENKGLLFAYLTFASLSMRFFAGRASDLYGRTSVLKISTFAMALSALVIGFASTRGQLIAGVVMYGLSHGVTSPALFAWATDLSDENHKGRGLASLYIFLELGIGIGALLGGLLHGNDTTQFPVTFGMCSLLSLGALGYLVSARSLKMPAA